VETPFRATVKVEKRLMLLHTNSTTFQLHNLVWDGKYRQFGIEVVLPT
jgi:hypothetical protein